MELTHALSSLPVELAEEIKEYASVKKIPAGTGILRAGQYVKVIPLVLEGLIKVVTVYEDKELLLYYIAPGESCIMTFMAGLQNEPSKISAMTEEETTALLLPTTRVYEWGNRYPAFNTLFFIQYNARYSDLLETIHQVLFENMDKRLFEYLKKKTHLTGRNPIKISHRQIANDLGTAREVISRVMKKLEHEGKVRQYTNSIEII